MTFSGLSQNSLLGLSQDWSCWEGLETTGNVWNWLEWLEMAKHGRKKSEMAGNCYSGWQCMERARNSWKITRTDEMGGMLKWLEIARNGWKRDGMAENGWNVWK